MRILLLAAMLLAVRAWAHVIPVDPSTCALDVGLDADGTPATVASAGDVLRAVYDAEGNPARSRVQLCPADTVDPTGRDRKSTRLNSSHIQKSRMPSSA